MRILVAYATSHGSTGEIAGRIAARLRAAGASVDCRPVSEVADLSGYQAVVVGSAIHDQEWLPEATDFLSRLGAPLGQVPVWLFSVGMPGALPGRVQGWAMQEEGQMLAKLSRVVTPRGHRLFSGVVRREHLTPGGRAKFRLMGGRYGDFRDWDTVGAWADAIAAEIDRAGQSPAPA